MYTGLQLQWYFTNNGRFGPVSSMVTSMTSQACLSLISHAK